MCVIHYVQYLLPMEEGRDGGDDGSCSAYNTRLSVKDLSNDEHHQSPTTPTPGTLDLFMFGGDRKEPFRRASAGLSDDDGGHDGGAAHTERREDQSAAGPSAFASPSWFSGMRGTAGIASSNKKDTVKKLLTALEEKDGPGSGLVRRARLLQSSEKRLESRVTSLDAELAAAATELGSLERSLHQERSRTSNTRQRLSRSYERHNLVKMKKGLKHEEKEEVHRQDESDDDDEEEEECEGTASDNSGGDDDESGSEEGMNRKQHNQNGVGSSRLRTRRDRHQKEAAKRKKLYSDVEVLKRELEAQRTQLREGQEKLLASEDLMGDFTSMLTALEQQTQGSRQSGGTRRGGNDGGTFGGSDAFVLPLSLVGTVENANNTVEVQSSTIVTLSDENVALRKALQESQEKVAQLQQIVKEQEERTSQKEAALTHLAESLEMTQRGLRELEADNNRLRDQRVNLENVNQALVTETERQNLLGEKQREQILQLERKAAKRGVALESYQHNIQQFTEELETYQGEHEEKLIALREEKCDIAKTLEEASTALETERGKKKELLHALHELESKYDKIYRQATENAAATTKRESELTSRVERSMIEQERLRGLLVDARERQSATKSEFDRIERNAREEARGYQVCILPPIHPSLRGLYLNLFLCSPLSLSLISPSVSIRSLILSIALFHPYLHFYASITATTRRNSCQDRRS